VLPSDSQYSQGSMTTPISTAEIPPTSRRYAIVLAILLLGIPIVAVALRASESMREPRPLQAAIQQTPRTADIAVLEARSRTAPTWIIDSIFLSSTSMQVRRNGLFRSCCP
jgi:hypothetical protein